MFEVLAPVSGIPRSVNLSAADGALRLGVYIRGPHDAVQDSHDIHAPFDAYIRAIDAHDFARSGPRYTIDPNKRGSLVVTFERHSGPRIIMTLEIEVGSGYVTDEIHMFAQPGQFVHAGARIGEIVIRPNNSFARITIHGIRDPHPDIIARIGHPLIGGKSAIVRVKE